MTLDDDQRDWLRRAVEQAEIPAAPETVDRLAHLVAGSMDAFRARQADETAARNRYDALRDVWLLADRPDPPIGQIRARIAALSPSALADIAARAAHLWPRVFRGETYPAEGFQAWCREAPAEQLIEAILRFVSYGGARVPGRKRSGGKRSASRLEPMIDGKILGRPDLSATEPDAGGRPTAYAADELVRFLANDWLEATGQAPQPGRSDKTGFGALVHHVFGWLGLTTPDQSLRRYWEYVATLAPTEIEGGLEYR